MCIYLYILTHCTLIFLETGKSSNKLELQKCLYIHIYVYLFVYTHALYFNFS